MVDIEISNEKKTRRKRSNDAHLHTYTHSEQKASLSLSFESSQDFSPPSLVLSGWRAVPFARCCCCSEKEGDGDALRSVDHSSTLPGPHCRGSRPFTKRSREGLLSLSLPWTPHGAPEGSYLRPCTGDPRVDVTYIYIYIKGSERERNVNNQMARASACDEIFFSLFARYSSTLFAAALSWPLVASTCVCVYVYIYIYRRALLNGGRGEDFGGLSAFG